MKRGAHKGRYDERTVRAVLREGLIAHVGIVTERGPVVIPMAYALDEHGMLVHGSAASRLMRTRAEVCATVTLLDGVVVARSLFESSMNYRSVAVFAVPEVLHGEAKREALLVLSEFLFPGRTDHARHPSDKELRATTVWRLPLTESSAKIRTGPALEIPDDLDLPTWGGIIPLHTRAGEPEDDGQGLVRETPEHVAQLARALESRR